ncbi:hypothetical protein AAFC00_000691 [Neodothiora populina]|uniref:Uncharacterized protein n=1 Tax=Neodothiora populina TaxID=2781224 RepID=A0ABR3PEV1_9PEZI
MPFFDSCPSGGTWFSCGSGSYFVGCCTSSDACQNGCSKDALKPASFDTTEYGKFPDQECPEEGSLWYTCAATSPPFMGCCKSNPCSNGSCPSGDLAAGRLNETNDAAYSPTIAASTAADTGMSSVSPASASSTAASTNSAGVIAGAVVGGVVGLLLILGVVFFCWRRARKAQGGHEKYHQPLQQGNGTSPFLDHAHGTSVNGQGTEMSHHPLNSDDYPSPLFSHASSSQPHLHHPQQSPASTMSKYSTVAHQYLHDGSQPPGSPPLPMYPTAGVVFQNHTGTGAPPPPGYSFQSHGVSGASPAQMRHVPQELSADAARIPELGER